MDDGTNVALLVLGIISTIIGSWWLIKKVIIIKQNSIIIGVIYDRRSRYGDGYLPVIKFLVDGNEDEYVSHHHSVFQRIGLKVKLVYDNRTKKVLGTISEITFIPLVISIVGLFVTFVMIAFYVYK